MRIAKLALISACLSILIGCTGNTTLNNNKPLLLHFVSKSSTPNPDPRKYPELNDLILRYYDYKIIRLSGDFDRRMAQMNFDYGRRNPRWNKSLSFEDYLRKRDSPFRLSSTDVDLVELYDIDQTPSYIVIDTDGNEAGRFSKMMSNEMLTKMLIGIGKGKKIDVTSFLKASWHFKHDDDRAEFARWLGNVIVQ